MLTHLCLKDSGTRVQRHSLPRTSMFRGIHFSSARLESANAPHERHSKTSDAHERRRTFLDVRCTSLRFQPANTPALSKNQCQPANVTARTNHCVQAAKIYTRTARDDNHNSVVMILKKRKITRTAILIFSHLGARKVIHQERAFEFPTERNRMEYLPWTGQLDCRIP